MSEARLLTFLRATLRQRAAAATFAGSLLVQAAGCVPDFSFPTGDGMSDGGEGGGTDSGGTTSGGSGGTDSGGSGATDPSGGEGGAIPADQLCDNERKDTGETGVDCGGPVCDPCPGGSPCERNRDCENNSCYEETCGFPPDCTNDTFDRDFGETDLDCGGPCAGCPDGDDCFVDGDCANLVCEGRVCQAPDCGDDRRNGSETDLNCGGGQHASGELCERCDIGKKCQRDSDCQSPPEGSGAIAKCEDPEPDDQDDQTVCVLRCPPNRGDCNQSAQDGCEIDLSTETSHCGACDDPCSPANAQGQCVAGNCQLVPDSCFDGFENCNGSPTDGCEVDVAIDADSCGSCEVACSMTNGDPSCSAGVCGITCDQDFADCNEDPGDGCEVNLLTSTLHCGDCDNACPSQAGYSATCDQGSCGEIACADASACGGQMPCGSCDSDQICDDLLDTEQNCGRCGVTCVAENGTPLCLDEGAGVYSCAVGSCNAPYADCDGSAINGCEANTQISNAHCGGCTATDPVMGAGEDCTAALLLPGLHVAETSCMGACTITSCELGWADCDGDFDNGCEVETTGDADHCGGCTSGPTTQWDGGLVCDTQFSNGTGECVDSQCVLLACNSGRGDCNDDAIYGENGNGCETNTNTNTTHCGACSGPGTPTGGEDCTDAIGSDNIATVGCSGGACQVATCSSGRADCNTTFSDGCEINTNTNVSHCGGCNAACTGRTHATPSDCSNGSCQYTCDPGWTNENGVWSDGCERAVIQLVVPSDRASATSASQNTGTGTKLTISHQLTSAAGKNRLLLVAVACKGNPNNCHPVEARLTDGAAVDVDLTLLGTTDHVNDSAGSIYYALDADLPAPGAYSVVLMNAFNNNNALTAEVLEFTGVKQDLFYADHDKASGGNCNSATPDVSVALTNVPKGSYVFAATTGQATGTSFVSDASEPLGDLVTNQKANGIVFATALSLVETATAGTQTPMFELQECNNSLMYAVAIQPETN